MECELGGGVQAVTRLGVPISPQELAAVIKRLDKNGDGALVYSEFTKMIELDPAEMYVCPLRTPLVKEMLSTHHVVLCCAVLRLAVD